MNRKLSRIIKSLDETTKPMVLAIIESPIKWDLLCFYQNNPFSIHTARGLANMIGRQVDQVLKEAEELIEFTILKKICENGETSSIYAYEPTDETAAILIAVVDMYKDDHTLIDELRQILRGD